MGKTTAMTVAGAVMAMAMAMPAHGFSSGSGTCVASAAAASPMGIPQAGNGGYVLMLAAGAGIPNGRYVPGATATLELSGVTQFKGLLLYAEDAQGNRVGGFGSFNLLNFRLIATCGGATDSTLTHSSSLLKTLPQTFMWRAPATDVGPVTFRAIALRGFNDYYVIESGAITAVDERIFSNSFEP
jgi:hypothetical protein